ncbi:MAG: tetratricopeptide repeat protein [Acidobacteriota bacterium]
MGGGPDTLLIALKDGTFVDNATKRQLKKQDQFVALTETGVHWAEEHRRQAILYGVIAVVATIVIVAAYTIFQDRSSAAATAFGQAMQIYQTPLAGASTEPIPGAKYFPDAKTRAAAALPGFQTVARQYGLTKSGRLAEYFSGLACEDLAQTACAEQAFQKVASGWDGALAALGKDALADLYQKTGRDAKAIALYNELSKGHALTVPPSLAQLQLAELYQSQGNTDQARQILALLKDKDKDPNGRPGAAAEIANQKLNPSSAAGAGSPE